MNAKIVKTLTTKRRLTLRRSLGLIGAVLCLLAAIFHAQLLTRLARLLIHDQSVPGSGYVAIIDGDRRYDVAAEQIAEGRLSGVLVLHEHPKALAVCGIVPARHEVAQRELRARGLDSEQVSVIKGEGRLLWDASERLGTWLGERDDELVVLTSQFGSARVRYIVDQTLPPELAARIHISVLVDRRFNEHDWWKTRFGCRLWFSNCVELAHTRIVGRPHPDDLVTWDPDAFERDLGKAVANK